MTAPAVLFLHPSDEPYGADRILVTMASGLARRGARVTVAISDDSTPGWTSARLLDAGIAVRRGPLAPARRRYLHPLRIVAYLERLFRARSFVLRLAREVRADVIHVNTSSLLVGALLGRANGVRVVWHVHEIVQRPFLMAVLFRLLPLSADVTIAVSGSTLANLWPPRLARRRGIVVRNGIDVVGLLEEHPRNTPLRVAFVGRLNRWKGYEVFVAAADKLIREGRPTTFVIAGSPPEGEEWRSSHLRDLVEATAAPFQFDILGLHNSPESLLASVDVVVVPSTLPDPLPTVVLEAMALGTPVVASAVGGIPEMIEDGRTGLLVPPGDAAGLATSIARLLDDEAYRRRVAAAARERFRSDFSTERFIDELQAAYGRLGYWR